METPVPASAPPVETARAIPADTAADDKFDSVFQSEATKDVPAEPADTKPADPAAPDVKAQDPVAPNATSDAKPTSVEPTEWNKWLAKYNGDPIAAGKAVWETNNRAAELARKNEELARQLEAAKTGTPPAQAQPQAPPTEQLPQELAYFKAEIQSVEAEYGDKFRERKLYVDESEKLDRTASTLRHKIKNGGVNVDKDALNDQLIETLDSAEQIKNYIGQLDRELVAKDKEWQRLGNQQRWAERVLEQDRNLRNREAKEREAEESGYLKTFSTSWNGTIDAVSRDVSAVPATSAANFVEFVKAKGMARVAGGEPIEDVDAYVREQAKEFKDMLEAASNARFADYSKNKAADTTLAAPTGKDAVAPKDERGRASWTPQQWEDHLESHRLL